MPRIQQGVWHRRVMNDGHSHHHGQGRTSPEAACKRHAHVRRQGSGVWGLRLKIRPAAVRPGPTLRLQEPNGEGRLASGV